MRQIVRHVMAGVARDGCLPGEHHFYIGFLTRYSGVRLSPRLIEQYPEEMTIILQHQFENLLVNEKGFEVSLRFGGINERIGIPFDAITQFFDPSVNFGLKFELIGKDEARPSNAMDDATPTPLTGKAEARAKRNTPTKGAASEPQVLPPKNGEPMAEPQPNQAKAGKTNVQTRTNDPKNDVPKSADVVSLDKFRKK